MKFWKIMLLTITTAVVGSSTTWGQSPEQPSPRRQQNINPVWRFTTGDPAGAPQSDYDDSGWDLVSLPHTHRVIDSVLHNYETEGRLVGWYRREITVPAQALHGKVFLRFQGAMESTQLWVNGVKAGEYAVSGYDSFHFDITAALQAGVNQLAVRVDNTEQPTLPPDGIKRDFVLFGGLYRDVDLIFTGKQYITFPWEAPDAGLRVTLPEVSESSAVVDVKTTLRNDADEAVDVMLRTRILDRDGKEVVRMGTSTNAVKPGADVTLSQRSESIPNPELWSPDSPYLYSIESSVWVDGRQTDQYVTPLGVRWVEWTSDRGFFLNGENLELVGVNRHQTKPFVGNAVPNSWHRRDAERIKAMGFNWVRLAHYPHDPDFLDALDTLGIMALAEGPSWMNIPNEEWLENLDRSFRRMIRRDRNRPSIIIWNACVNHQKKHPVLVQAALEEDPTRARGQDTVPAPMDFRHKQLSGNGALCIEHTGHTFNTFRGQGGTLHREYLLAQRHWEHTDASYKQTENAGLAVWCMYDYNTPHYGKPFFAAPHGIYDLFEIPKLTHWWHRSELGEAPITYGALIQDAEACVFTNADMLRFYESADGVEFTEVAELRQPEGTQLKHPPYHVSVSEESRTFRADGLQDGRVVSSHVFHRPGEEHALEMTADCTTMLADGADLNRVVVKLVDQNGTVMVKDSSEVQFSIEGEGRMVGENPAMLRAGQFMILVQSTFSAGPVTVSASLPGKPELGVAKVSFSTIPVSDPTVDMPDTTGLRPTGDTIVSVSEDSLKRGLDEMAGAYDWFTFPRRKNRQPSEYLEAPAIMVATDKEELDMQVKNCEYRIYSSEWSTEPAKLKNGDAVFFRKMTPDRPGQKHTSTVTIDGVTRTWETWNKKQPKEAGK